MSSPRRSSWDDAASAAERRSRAWSDRSRPTARGGRDPHRRPPARGRSGDRDHRDRERRAARVRRRRRRVGRGADLAGGGRNPERAPPRRAPAACIGARAPGHRADPRPAAREGRGGAREQRQEPVSRRHQPRAANADERDSRLRATARVRGPHGGAGGQRPADPARGRPPARADHRAARHRAHRGRRARPLARAGRARRSRRRRTRPRPGAGRRPRDRDLGGAPPSTSSPITSGCCRSCSTC